MERHWILSMLSFFEEKKYNTKWTKINWNLKNQYLIINNCASNVNTDTAYNNSASPYSGKMHLGFYFYNYFSYINIII